MKQKQEVRRFVWKIVHNTGRKYGYRKKLIADSNTFYGTKNDLLNMIQSHWGIPCKDFKLIAKGYPLTEDDKKWLESLEDWRKKYPYKHKKRKCKVSTFRQRRINYFKKKVPINAKEEI